MLDFLRNRYGYSAIVAEMGVLEGAFSAAILDVAKPFRLHLIDMWAHTEAEPDSEVNAADDVHEKRFRAVSKRFRSEVEAGRVFIHRGDVAEVMPRFAWGYFDWAYVDVLHDKQSVLTDLRNALEAVRPGGAICGHDYDQRKPHYGVVEAVQQFIGENPGLSLDGLTTDGDDISWMILLPPAVMMKPRLVNKDGKRPFPGEMVFHASGRTQY